MGLLGVVLVALNPCLQLSAVPGNLDAALWLQSQAFEARKGGPEYVRWRGGAQQPDRGVMNSGRVRGMQVQCVESEAAIPLPAAPAALFACRVAV